MLRLLLLLPLLSAAGTLPTPLRRHRSASLLVGPYLTRYLTQQEIKTSHQHKKL